MPKPSRRPQAPPRRNPASLAPTANTSPFDFTGAMTRLCVDVCEQLDVFRHVDMERVAVTFSQARRSSPWGMQAKLIPLRFENGATTTIRGGRTWGVQRVVLDGREMLYILSFYLPRFQNQSFREKLTTVLHELYHVSPDFDGDVRRFEGRYQYHSASQKDYDKQMERLAARYLARTPSVHLCDFLRLPFAELTRQHGGVVGRQIRTPKLIPLPAPLDRAS